MSKTKWLITMVLISPAALSGACRHEMAATMAGVRSVSMPGCESAPVEDVVKALVAQRDALAAELRVVRSRLAEAQQAATEARSKAAAMTSRAESAEAKARRCGEELAAMASQAQSQRDTLAKAQAALAQLQARISQFEASEAKSLRRADDAERLAATRLAEVLQAREAVSAMRDRSARRESELEAARADLARHEAAAAESHAEVQQLRLERAQAQREVHSLREQIAMMRTEGERDTESRPIAPVAPVPALPAAESAGRWNAMPWIVVAVTAVGLAGLVWLARVRRPGVDVVGVGADAEVGPDMADLHASRSAPLINTTAGLKGPLLTVSRGGHVSLHVRGVEAGWSVAYRGTPLEAGHVMPLSAGDQLAVTDLTGKARSFHVRHVEAYETDPTAVADELSGDAVMLRTETNSLTSR